MYIMKNNFIKTIALVIAILFTWNTIAMSAPDSVYRVNVPEKFGKVKERYKLPDISVSARPDESAFNKDSLVVIVQDAHSNSEAQFNLAEIICSLLSQIKNSDAESNVPFIGIEGAVGEYDLKSLREFPVAEAKAVVGKQFVKDGKLLGAELASIIADGDFTLYGLEDQDLFQSDFKAFYDVAQNQAELEKGLSLIEGRLFVLKEQLFSEKLKAFDNNALQFENGQTEIMEYIPFLYKQVDELKIDLFSYLMLARFKEILLHGNQVAEESFNQKIDFGILLKDIATCSHDVRIMLSESDAERQLVVLCKKIMLIKRLFSLKALKEEVQTYKSNVKDYSIEFIIDEINTLAAKNNVELPSTERVLNINAGILESINEFYALAEKRDKVMVDNLLAKMKENNQSVGVLVAGGYHSDGMKNLLKQKGISYITVTPNINSAACDVAYMDRMLGQVVPIDPFMASHLQVSRINASVKALSEIGFEDILKDAGVQIKGQTFFNREQIDEIINLLKDRDETIAQAFEQIAGEIYENNLIEKTLDKGVTGEDAVQSVMANLRRELGALVEKEVDVRNYLSVMETHFKALMDNQAVEAKEPAGSSADEIGSVAEIDNVAEEEIGIIEKIVVMVSSLLEEFISAIFISSISRLMFDCGVILGAASFAGLSVGVLWVLIKMHNGNLRFWKGKKLVSRIPTTDERAKLIYAFVFFRIGFVALYTAFGGIVTGAVLGGLHIVYNFFITKKWNLPLGMPDWDGSMLFVPDDDLDADVDNKPKEKTRDIPEKKINKDTAHYAFSSDVYSASEDVRGKDVVKQQIMAGVIGQQDRFSEHIPAGHGELRRSAAVHSLLSNADSENNPQVLRAIVDSLETLNGDGTTIVVDEESLARINSVYSPRLTATLEEIVPDFGAASTPTQSFRRGEVLRVDNDRSHVSEDYTNLTDSFMNKFEEQCNAFGLNARESAIVDRTFNDDVFLECADKLCAALLDYDNNLFVEHIVYRLFRLVDNRLRSQKNAVIIAVHVLFNLAQDENVSDRTRRMAVKRLSEMMLESDLKFLIEEVFINKVIGKLDIDPERC